MSIELTRHLRAPRRSLLRQSVQPAASQSAAEGATGIMSTAQIALRLLASALVGYLLGSLPSGVIVGRVFGNVDPRAQGSGKTGATNVLRTMGTVPAVLVALLDVAK